MANGDEFFGFDDELASAHEDHAFFTGYGDEKSWTERGPRAARRDEPVQRLAAAFVDVLVEEVLTTLRRDVLAEKEHFYPIFGDDIAWCGLAEETQASSVVDFLQDWQKVEAGVLFGKWGIGIASAASFFCALWDEGPNTRARLWRIDDANCEWQRICRQRLEAKRETSMRLRRRRKRGSAEHEAPPQEEPGEAAQRAATAPAAAVEHVPSAYGPPQQELDLARLDLAELLGIATEAVSPWRTLDPADEVELEGHVAAAFEDYFVPDSIEIEEMTHKLKRRRARGILRYIEGVVLLEEARLKEQRHARAKQRRQIGTLGNVNGSASTSGGGFEDGGAATSGGDLEGEEDQESNNRRTLRNLVYSRRLFGDKVQGHFDRSAPDKAVVDSDGDTDDDDDVYDERNDARSFVSQFFELRRWADAAVT